MPTPRPLALLVLGSLVVSVVAPPGSVATQATPAPAQATPAPGQAPPYPVAARSTAITVAATHDPLRVPGSDGLDHLDYDLVVTNGFAAPVTLTAVEALIPDGDTLLRLDGDALVAATQPLLGTTPTAAIPASGAVAVVVDVTVPPGTALERLTHRITYTYPAEGPLATALGSFVVAGPELTVDARRPVAIAPPLRGDGWLAANGCCAPASRHRAVRVPVDGDRIAKPETFAIDWVQLRAGELFDGDGARNEDWYDFGAEVQAVADGTVVYARDGMPEQPVGQELALHQPEDYGGNQLIIQIEPGVFAVYAHLQTGSLAVAVGDRVTVGQPIARLGNSGNTTAPHLHFGLLDAPDPLTGTSLPMAFDRWTLAGTIAPAAWAAAGTAATPFPLVPTGGPRAEAATCPLFLDIADFG